MSRPSYNVHDPRARLPGNLISGTAHGALAGAVAAFGFFALESWPRTLLIQQPDVFTAAFFVACVCLEIGTVTGFVLSVMMIETDRDR